MWTQLIYLKAEGHVINLSYRLQDHVIYSCRYLLHMNRDVREGITILNPHHQAKVWRRLFSFQLESMPVLYAAGRNSLTQWSPFSSDVSVKCEFLMGKTCCGWLLSLCVCVCKHIIDLEPPQAKCGSSPGPDSWYNHLTLDQKSFRNASLIRNIFMELDMGE